MDSIERGTCSPLASAIERLRPRDVITQLSNLFSKLGSLTVGIGGRVGFIVTGEGGGAWCVDLGHPGGRWSTLVEGEAVSATIVASESAFPAILFDAAIVRELLRKGEIRVEGERAKLGAIGALLSQGGSALHLRANGATTSSKPRRIDVRRGTRR